MARLAREFKPKAALDMGCGSGYLALMMKSHGVSEVWAADIHGPAVECARKNVAQKSRWTDLGRAKRLVAISPDVKFDLIMFNQPFGPGDDRQVCGCGMDGGFTITRRFLLEASAHLSGEGVVMMAFSDREDPEPDPKQVAKDLGYEVTTLLHAFYNGANNFLYAIRLPQ